MRLIFLLFLFLFFSCKSAKVEENVLAKPDIRATTYLTFLASDDLNGRDTGTPGIEKAASYIEQVFSSSDIKPFFDSYRDPFKVKDLEAFNVVGYIEGNDPDLKDEYILVGAHYDHIGQRAKPVNKDSIANGANDNAAGTVAVLMIAEELKRLNTNKRSIIFALFSAEEMGLQGSKHLSQRLSTLGIDLYTVVNFEMIGVPLI
ncbi:MAG: M20/M25/M40 family metallo-hydrolase, partial [Flavobacteriaceae bacterium]|nr:M20/M25/M40 family metallo-hydrolase [Flavobacteriaceae bacterium]